MTPDELQREYLSDDCKLKMEFQKGDELRDILITRCEKYASWTLPHLFPDENYSSEELQYDYQSTGAQAVIHLANKIMMALFQPSQPFFRFKLTTTQRNEIKQAINLSDADIDAALSDGEKETMGMFRRNNNRAQLIDLIMLLIITGNGMIEAKPNKGIKLWTLHDYQVKRDLAGEVLSITFRETKALVTLSEEIQTKAREAGYTDPESDVTLYTGIKRVSDGRYIVWQELEDVCQVQKQIGIYNEDTLPWIPLVWNKSRDRDYGTGLVECYAGAFHTLSTLSEASLDYTTIVTDVKNLVDPTGMTDVETITNAESGAYVPGREEDLFIHTPNVGDATQFLDSRIQAATRQLASAFLMNSQVVRDAERVTAEEVRMLANELEGSMGGTYSRLGNDLQLPLAKRYSAAIDPVFKEVEPEIITGLESLSRTSDLDRLRYFFQDAAQLADLPEALAEQLDYRKLIEILGIGHQVEYDKFMLDEDVVKQKQQERSQAIAAEEGMKAQEVAAAQTTG